MLRNGSTLLRIVKEDIINGQVYVPEDITAIESGAFKEIEGLKSVIIPANVKKIGSHAFSNSSIEEVIIEEGVEEIGNSVFKACRNLKKVVLPESIVKMGQAVFYECNNLEEVNFPKNLDKVPNQTFWSCFKLTQMNLPEGIKQIGKQAFYNCRLEKINLQRVEKIHDEAFAMCERLKNIDIPDSVVYLGRGTFRACFNLSKIDIPESVTTIEFECFASCSRLKEAILPNNLETINVQMFKGCASLEKIHIPTNVKNIYSEAFMNTGLKEVVLPEGLQTIGNRVFNCTSIKSIVLPSSVKSIEAETFANSKMLETIDLSKTQIKKIPDSCFSNCVSLNYVNLPDTIEDISMFAFQMCQSLQELELPHSLKDIRYGVFQKSGLVKISLPENTTIYKAVFFDCNNLEAVFLPKNLKEVSSELFKHCVNLKSIKIPENVTAINKEAFLNCTSLKEVVFNEKLETIEESAFKLTGLKTLSLPNSINLIEYDAFCLMPNLEKAVLPQSLEKLPCRMFYGCANLEEVVFPKDLKFIENATFENCTSLKKLNLPEGLISIGFRGFLGCENLENFVLPHTVNNIGAFAFAENKKIQVVELPNAYVDKDAFSSCKNLNAIIVPSENRCMLTKEESNLNYMTIIDNKFFFTREKLGEDSLIINEIKDVPFGLWTACYKDKNKFLKEIANYKILSLYKTLFAKLDRKKFDEFFIERNIKFFKQLDIMEFEGKNFEALCKIYYNLGGFLQPREEIHISKNKNEIKQVVDYAQKVGEFIKENILARQNVNSVLNFYTLNHFFQDMEWAGFKKGFTNFFLDKNNFLTIVNELRKREKFASECYNIFEKAQKHNTSSRGSQRQLAPTVENFKRYLLRSKFQGVTDENELLAQTISEYYSQQKFFDLALQIDAERKERGTSDHILGEPLKEADVFKTIEDYSKKIEVSALNTLNILTDLAGKVYTYEWLAKSDPKNMILGKLCSCCSCIDGVGSAIVRASMVHPDIQSVVIRDQSNTIVAKSTLYVNRIMGYGVFNNVEVREDISYEQKNRIYDTYIRAVNAFAERYNEIFKDKPLKFLTVGMSRNDLTEQIVNNHDQSKLHPAINYSRFGIDNFDYNGDSNISQRYLWKKEDYDERGI